jgi:sarcosine oxidase subunit alpha
MSWRDAPLVGVPIRLARISFSGELAFEVYVNPWYARGVWERIIEAGRPYGITPYGTETMHVLRAEKGYPIIGQETDGTVTPQDLGMDWIVSKKKRDFVGLRSLSRADTARTDRKHVVGLLPEQRLEEGAQLVPGPGHVTSSYLSAALGRPFALALLARGRERIGETVHADGVAAQVVDSVLYDKEGARRDGRPA